MIKNTKAIVLRVVKYGETSVVLTALTETFGLQSYLIRGVRKQGKSDKTSLLQPGAFLEMDVYHRAGSHLQNVRNLQWHRVHVHLFSDVMKNGMMLFMIELLLKTVTEPEHQPELFAFCEDALQWLDHADTNALSLFPLFFALHLTHFFGFRISVPKAEVQENSTLYINLQDGVFTQELPQHAFWLDGREAYQLAELLKAVHPNELKELEFYVCDRGKMLDSLMLYYRLHVPSFGEMRALPVLRMVLK